MAQLTPTRRQRSSQLAKDVETTRLPYLIDAGLRLRDSQHHVEPGAWTAPIVAEERHDGEQNPSGNRPFVHTQDKKLKLKRAKKQVARLHPRLKRSNSREDEPGGYVPKLPELDERVLILYHSSLKRAWKQQQKQIEVDTPTPSLTHYGHEAIYAATQIQKIVRESEIHAQCSRCKGCQLDSCTEGSLFGCFMVRYVGLHDFKGAKTLCEDGLRLFSSSVKFVFFYGIILQAMGEDIETSMAFLKRAKEIGITNEELSETHFFQPAHLLRPNDAQAFLDLAILCQSRDQLPRAEANYAKALAQLPQEYAIPGYLHRINMVDRLLLNYHRFCSIFNFRQVNVLLKEVFTAKKGKKVRLMVSKLNHFTVITPMDSPTTCRINALYLTDDEALSIIMLSESEDEDSKELKTGSTTKYVGARRSSNINASMRQQTYRSAPKDIPEKTPRLLSKTVAITQIYQQECVGLNVKPSDLAQFSEVRSKLRLTKSSAELLLNALVFVDPVANHTEASNQGGENVVFQKVMLIPSILKTRQQHHCIQAINLRNLSAGDKETPELPLPMTVDDTARLVEAMAERVILVPALRMATQDLKVKASAGFTISVQPPPKMHFIYQRKSSGGSTRTHANTTSPPTLQFVYPVTDGLRGVSIGTKHFRKKCTRHAVQFTRCRCMLPIISTSAHIEAISRALAPPSTSSES
ncbi:hypothetical protein JG687_00004188 [Phytophthora cactorum]|uniref:Tetratricopeptide repeat n=1 Tax=Phytophthora cactorum TaxID=29920 RepID=A0A8T1URY5_9STRA|nr:Tetratricopeptide-like helical domain [Phytophthora cactorum]KAG6967602.1 hypothetical protein JG687_00004188 [Phytophthora cactorum]